MHQALQAGRDRAIKAQPQREGGFIATAEHFEGRAKQARSAEDSARFADAAKFYRALGAITPSLPRSYRAPQQATQRVSAQAQRFSGRAEMCRAIAECLLEEGQKLSLLRMAESYEQLASRTEN